jgi:nitrate/nitrite transport system permease protein
MTIPKLDVEDAGPKAGVVDAPPQLTVVGDEVGVGVGGEVPAPTPTAEPATTEPATTEPAAPGDLAPALPRQSRLLKAAGSLVWAVVGVVGFIGLWLLATTRYPQLVTPGDTFAALKDMLSDPFFDDGAGTQGVGILVKDSLIRVFEGWTIAQFVGIPLGIFVGANRRAWQAINPLVQIFRPVSPLAWVPIWTIALQDTSPAAIIVVFLTALWPTVLNTAAGAASVPADQRDVARVFRFGRWAYLRHVLFPNALPQTVTGMRLSMGVSWLVLVAVEMLAGKDGIGRSIWTWYNAGSLDKVAAGIFIIGLVGLALDALLLRLGRVVALDEGSPA